MSALAETMAPEVAYAMRQLVEQQVNLMGELLRKHASHRVKLRALAPAAETAVTVAARVLRLPAVRRVSDRIREAPDAEVLEAAAAIKFVYAREGESMVSRLLRNPVSPKAAMAAKQFALETRGGVERSPLAQAVNRVIDERIARGGIALEG